MGEDSSGDPRPSETPEYDEIKRRVGDATFRARKMTGSAIKWSDPVGWIKRFLTFEELIGLQLTVALYYIGCLLIVVTTVWTMLNALGSLTTDAMGVLGVWLIGPLTAIVSLMLLRLLCERMYIYFRDRIGTPGGATDDLLSDGMGLDDEG